MANSGNSVSSLPEKQPKNPVCREINFGPFPPSSAKQPRETHKNKSPPKTTNEANLDPKIINIVSSSENTISAARVSEPTQLSIQHRHRSIDAPTERKRKCRLHSKPNKKKAHKGTCSTSHMSPAQQFHFIGHDRNDINITLMSSNAGDRGFPFIMKPVTLRYPCKHYAECIDVCPHDIKLYKEGQELNKHGTADTNGLKDGDHIIVEGVDPFINVDTRYKVLTIQDMMPQNQMTLQHMAPLTLTMEELHQLWATFAEKDLDTFVLVYNEADIRRSQKTVAEAEFMNEDIIYCRTKDPAQSSGTLGSSEF